MKKISSLIFSLLILSLFSVSVIADSLSTYIQESSLIKVSLYRQDPDPAEPGQYVELRFNIENLGSATVQKVEVKIEPKYPFTLKKGDSALKTFVSVKSNLVGDDGAIAKYTLLVDKDAVEGEDEIEVYYRLNDDPRWFKTEPFAVNIRTFDAIISVEKAEVSPQRIPPGKSGLLNLTLDNMADSILRNVQVKLNFNSSVPLLTLDSSNQKTVKVVDRNERINLQFQLQANPEAEADLYEIPISIRYTDSLGNNYSNQETIGLVVGDAPELGITLKDSEITKTKQKGNILIDFVNRGVINIKFLNVKLLPSEDYEIIGTDENYLGNIDSDDFETAEFEIYAQDENPQLSFLIEYQDANNINYEKELELELKTYTSQELKRFGLDNQGGFLNILTIIVFLVILFFVFKFYRRYKKRKDKKTKRQLKNKTGSI